LMGDGDGAPDREAIIAGLVARGVGRDRAGQYADAYLEYREASLNIAAQGAMVLHPRTANPIENPYLKIRDRALVKLRNLRGIKADWLW
jgi:Phage terminase, small subunit